MDDFERTALHRAARKGHKQVLRLLIDRGSDVLMYDSNGLLASDLAAKKKFDPSITKVMFFDFFFCDSDTKRKQNIHMLCREPIESYINVFR